jgi:hypothetical protein
MQLGPEKEPYMAVDNSQYDYRGTKSHTWSVVDLGTKIRCRLCGCDQDDVNLDTNLCCKPIEGKMACDQTDSTCRPVTIEDEDLRVLLILAHRYATYRTKDGSRDTVDELWEKYGKVLREDDRTQEKTAWHKWDLLRSMRAASYS